MASKKTQLYTEVPCSNCFKIRKVKTRSLWSVKNKSKGCYSCAKKGVVPSLETRKRMSEKKLGFIPWNKGLKGVTVPWNKGLKGFSTGKIHDWMPKGEKHYLYKKDRTQLQKSEKKHLDGRYREWMLGVKKRDNWKCRIADVNCDGRLEAHHILNWKDYTELRYQINNGITLCHAHHPRGRAKEKRLSSYFMELVSVSKE